MLSWVEFGSERKLETGANGKIKAHALVVETVALQGETKIKIQGRPIQEQTKPETPVRVIAGSAEVVGVGVDETGVVKKGEARGADDLERILEAEEAVGLAADGLAGGILGADGAVIKTAQRVGAAE